MKRKAVFVAALAALSGLGASPAEAIEFHSQNVGGSLFALWSSCEAAAVGQPCSTTVIWAATEMNDPSLSGPQHMRDCVEVQQGHIVKGVVPHSFDWTVSGERAFSFNVCGVASVQVAASLVNGSVDGELPMQNCHYEFYPVNTYTCGRATPIKIALDWLPNGDISRSGNDVLSYFSEVRCQDHIIPSRGAHASVTGQIDGLPDRLGAFEGASIGWGGEGWIGCYD